MHFHKWEYTYTKGHCRGTFWSNCPEPIVAIARACSKCPKKQLPCDAVGVPWGWSTVCEVAYERELKQHDISPPVAQLVRAGAS